MGFRNKAQGCESASYPGQRIRKTKTPTGFWLQNNVCCMSQPHWGCGFGASYLPRVARGSQPWASGRNPFGIGRFSKSDLRPGSPGEGDLTLTVSSRIDRSSIEPINKPKL